MTTMSEDLNKTERSEEPTRLRLRLAEATRKFQAIDALPEAEREAARKEAEGEMLGVAEAVADELSDLLDGITTIIDRLMAMFTPVRTDELGDQNHATEASRGTT